MGSGLCEPDEDDSGIELVRTFLLPSRLSLGAFTHKRLGIAQSYRKHLKHVQSQF